MEQTTTRQKNSAPSFGGRLHMQAICENGKDKERSWGCQSAKKSAADCGALLVRLKSYAVVFAQYFLKASANRAAISCAGRISISLRCMKYTSLPSRMIPIEGEDGGNGAVYARAFSVASRS